MNLGTLISAANWLYENSPAKNVTEKNNAILVYGDNELADALFDLLFTTAFMRKITIELVRVCTDATNKGEAFLSRNPDGLKHFTRSKGSNSDSHRPLAIHFIEAHLKADIHSKSEVQSQIDVQSQVEWKAFNYAYVIIPKWAELASKPEVLFWLDDIPVIKSKGDTWSRMDEAVVPVLRVARKVHTAYTLGWNDRYREEDIDRDLYGSLASNMADDYMLRSSLRLAVSIPWKLAIAEVLGLHELHKTPNTVAEELHQKLNSSSTESDNASVRDYLAWQEHRSWQAFMTLDGWRAPTPDEMQEYLFKNGNDHRNKKNIDKDGKRRPLHPCLCDLMENDWFSGKRSLKDIVPSEWSKIISSDALEDFTLMDQFSLLIHHGCKEIVTSTDYSSIMAEQFMCIEEALISAHLTRVDIHFQQLRLIENLFLRLQNNEPNSYHPFNQACRTFLEDACGENDAVKKAYLKMLSVARVAIERNKYCDYKEIDARIIDWLPWIITEKTTDVIYKLYTDKDLFENILSSMILRPGKLIFICSKRNVPEHQLQIYRKILAQHGLNTIDVATMLLSEFDLSQWDENMASSCVVDVSGAGDMQHSVKFPDGVGVVFYENGNLRDKVGYRTCAAYYKQYITVTVNEMLQMKGQQQLSIEENNEMLGMEQDYESLWEFARRQGGAGNLSGFVGILKNAEKRLRHEIFRDTGIGSEHQSRELTEEQCRALIKNGGVRSLYDLQKKKAISGLIIDMVGKAILFNIFPTGNLQEADQYIVSRNTIDFILTRSEQSELIVDDEYAKISEPILVYDLSSPLRLSEKEAKELTSCISEGLLIDNGNKEYTYKSLQTRHILKKEGAALEAYVYYTLFLSGRFDDVRVNIKMSPGLSANGQTLEKEVDVMVTLNGVMGLISCKDTSSVELFHIVELANQAREYGTIAKPILVCSKDADLAKDIKDACTMLQVERIGIASLTGNKASKRRLVNSILKVLV